MGILIVLAEFGVGVLLELLVELVFCWFFRLLDLVLHSEADRKRTNVLRRKLANERFRNGCSLKRLRRVTGTSSSECRRLLMEIGAEGITLEDGSEGWRLRR